MFGLLKDKLSGFIKNLTGRAEKKEEERKPEEAKEERLPGLKNVEVAVPMKEEPEKIGLRAEPGTEGKKLSFDIPFITKKEEPKHISKPEVKPAIEIMVGKKVGEMAVEAVPAPKPKIEERKAEIAHAPKIEYRTEEVKLGEKIAVAPMPRIVEVRKGALGAPELQIHKPAAREVPKQPEPVRKVEEKRLESIERKALGAQKKPAGVKLGIGSILRSFVSNEVEISEGDVTDLLDELELSLLESDVAYEVALEIVQEMRSRLVGKRVPKNGVDASVKEAIRGSIIAVLTSDRAFDIIEKSRGTKPAKIIFIGPNGAGKTTTMAKVASMFMASGMSVVFAASDTFRAAAIEQLEEHAKRLGVKVIKSAYGSDPAAVAFDGVNYAKSHNIDAVLIDTSGRQDTNANLLDELKKMKRVISPDMKIYVGESIAGNALIDQVRSFDGTVGLDGVILTKMDCDAKGGTALSVLKATGVPVIYIGTGQKYADIKRFVPSEIADQIIGS